MHAYNINKFQVRTADCQWLKEFPIYSFKLEALGEHQTIQVSFMIFENNGM